ncbi:hypothetical protein D3C77_154640 [compost metagenome]
MQQHGGQPAPFKAYIPCTQQLTTIFRPQLRDTTVVVQIAERCLLIDRCTD